MARGFEIVTIFLGAFLVFLVQPLVGNTLLPVFGGTATVWSICLAAFQILLVAGYFYAHIFSGTCSSVCSKKWLAYAHPLLLFGASAWVIAAVQNRLAIVEIARMMPPAVGVLAVIALMVAIPYVVISANSSIVQDLSGGRYGLYAVSNLGSLAGLWAYPFLFEPFLPLGDQWLCFAGIVFLYAVLFCILIFCSHPVKRALRYGTPVAAVPPNRLQYFLLSALSCYLINAVSTHLCSDITPIPLMWVALLSVYLLSYALAFTNGGSRIAKWLGVVVVPLVLIAAWHMGLEEFRHWRAEVVIGATLLFLGGFAIHSRLYRLRPSSEHLTMYYFIIAIGGATGGAICSFLMPVASDRIVEYPIAVALVTAVCLADMRDLLSEKHALATSIGFIYKLVYYFSYIIGFLCLS